MLRKCLTASMAALGAVLLIVPGVGIAGTFPSKNIEFIIPYGPGGGFDRTTRMVIPYLEKYLPNHVTVVPKNVPGAGGRKGSATLYRAKPDGYTIGIMNMPGAAIPQMLGEKVAYDVDKLTWLGVISGTGYALSVAGKSPYKSVADLKKLGRPVKFTATGRGSTAYAVSEIATHILGIDAEFITGYKGSSSYIVGLIRGDGDASVTPVSTVRKFVASGDVRPVLAMETRSSFAGVPTGADVGNAELDQLSLLRMVAAPPGTPAATVKVLSDALQKALADPGLIAAAKKAKEPLKPMDSHEAVRAERRMMNLYGKYKQALSK